MSNEIVFWSINVNHSTTVLSVNGTEQYTRRQRVWACVNMSVRTLSETDDERFWRYQVRIDEKP